VDSKDRSRTASQAPADSSSADYKTFSTANAQNPSASSSGRQKQIQNRQSPKTLWMGLPVSGLSRMPPNRDNAVFLKQLRVDVAETLTDQITLIEGFWWTRQAEGEGCFNQTLAKSPAAIENKLDNASAPQDAMIYGILRDKES
jgi:hypothetical protein